MECISYSVGHTQSIKAKGLFIPALHEIDLLCVLPSVRRKGSVVFPTVGQQAGILLTIISESFNVPMRFLGWVKYT